MRFKTTLKMSESDAAQEGDAVVTVGGFWQVSVRSLCGRTKQKAALPGNFSLNMLMIAELWISE